MISTITSKGQITIPVVIRRAAGLEPGSQVEFIVNARQRIEQVPRHGDIRALRGVVPAPANPVSLGAMNMAVASVWARTVPSAAPTPTDKAPANTPARNAGPRPPKSP